MITGKQSEGPRNLYFMVSSKGFRSNFNGSISGDDGLGKGIIIVVCPSSILVFGVDSNNALACSINLSRSRSHPNWASWAKQLQLFCKFVNFNEVFQFLYDLFCHERLNLQLSFKMKPHHWFVCIFLWFIRTIPSLHVMYICFNSNVWQNCDWLSFINRENIGFSLCFIHRYISWFDWNLYPLWSTDIVDDWISTRYILWFVIEMDSMNDSIGYY